MEVYHALNYHHPMDSTTISDFSWLLSAAAEPLLEQTQTAFIDRVNPVRIAKSLRKQTTATRAAMIVDQAQLRIRGRVKFASADRMFFTRRGLEQSTGEDLARYKSQRFAGVESVVDVCCGIGGDLISLLGRDHGHQTLGVDTDPLTVMFAKHNAELHLMQRGLSQRSLKIVNNSFADFDLGDCAGVHCDPDRRMNERTIVASRFSPPLEEVFQRASLQTHVAIKIAPATVLTDDVPPMIEREWLGDRRECKQQILWYGPNFNRPGQRTATCLDGNNVHQISFAEEDLDITVEVTNQLRRYLYEPHPTVLAAGLTPALAHHARIARLTLDVDYLTSSQPIEHPLLTRFEVVDAFSMDLRRTVETLKKLNVGLVEVKKRGVGKELFDQFERMKLKGPHRATVILTRIGSQRLVAIARRTPDDFPL